jgi:hypothetical protein
MPNNEESQPEKSAAWFAIGEEDNEEDFFPIPSVVPVVPPSPPEPQPTIKLPASEMPPQASDKETVPEKEVAEAMPAQQEERALKQIPTTVMEDSIPKKEKSPLQQQPPAAIQEIPPEESSSAQSNPQIPSVFGFRQIEAMRIGGTSVNAPMDCAGLLVIVSTPQVARLGQIMPLREARTIIGRSLGVGCFLDDPDVAGLHAAITHQKTEDGSAFFLHSTFSAPVAVNGTAADALIRLQSTDRIRIANTEMIFFWVALKR